MFRVIEDNTTTSYNSDYYQVEYDSDGTGIIKCGDKPIVRVQPIGCYNLNGKDVTVFSYIHDFLNHVKNPAVF